MPENTVVCWDGSDAAEAALEWALRRPRDSGDTLQLLDVLDSSLFLGDTLALERATDEEQDRLDNRADLIEEQHPGALSGHTLSVGVPLDELTNRTTPDTLLVVGTRHREGPRVRYGWSLGARLAASAAGPVAIVPTEAADAARDRSGVVVGIDGSDIARLALEFAANEAVVLGQPLTVVHCWQEPLADEPLVVPDEDFVDAQQSAHQELLDAEVSTIRKRHPELRIESRLLRSNPITGLRAQSEHASMIVVGSRRLTGWRRAWLGSVSHGLVLDLAAPIVVVGPETTVRRGDTLGL